jgi:predicted nucleotidyltransferase
VRLAFLFGSVAGGTEETGSDIDVMLVGDKLSLEVVVTALEGVQHELRREVNPTVYSTEEFCRKLSEKATTSSQPWLVSRRFS